MTGNRTRRDFLAFLDWLSEKGLMRRATVASRKASAAKVLRILSDDEAQDVTALDLDDVLRRFTNLEGRNFTPGSLITYGSRLRSALKDFKQYLDAPLSFRPGVQSRERRKADARKEAASEMRGTGPTAPANALSIPIRPGTAIVIHGLPYDLNESEAAKVANVIHAMATPNLNNS